MKRRDFIIGATGAVGAAWIGYQGLARAIDIDALPPLPRKFTAADTVTLGKTGIPVSILGFGSGSRFLMYEAEDRALEALSHALAQAGHPPRRVHTTAKVHLEKTADGFGIPRIDLVCAAEVPGLDTATFQEQAEQAKKGCPVSKVLAGAQITLDAKLIG